MTIELPTPDFELLWKNGEYKVTKPGIESAKCYTADQMRAYGEACAKAEREACAREVEDAGGDNADWHAERIRAR